MDKYISCEIAKVCLIYLMEDEDEFSKFMSITGIKAEHIRPNLNNADFLRGILEYVLNWEPLLNNISSHSDIKCEDFPKAYKTLLGDKQEYQSI